MGNECDKVRVSPTLGDERWALSDYSSSGKKDWYSWRNVEGIGEDVAFFNPQIAIARMLGNAGYSISVSSGHDAERSSHLREVTVRATTAAKNALWEVLYGSDVAVVTSAVSGEPELTQQGLEKDVRWDEETKNRLHALSYEQKAVHLDQNHDELEKKIDETVDSEWQSNILVLLDDLNTSAKQARAQAARYWVTPSFSKEELTGMIEQVVSDYTRDHSAV